MTPKFHSNYHCENCVAASLSERVAILRHHDNYSDALVMRFLVSCIEINGIPCEGVDHVGIVAREHLVDHQCQDSHHGGSVSNITARGCVYACVCVRERETER